MAFAGNGEPMIVTKESEAAGQAERFRQYINTPVLTQIKFNPGSFQAYDIEPASVPDMMAERPILIFGKYNGKPQGTVSLTGKVGRKPFKQSYNLSSLKADPANSALRYLWARERIKYLSYLAGEYANDQSPEAKQILELGLKYNLMTNYTSFVAIDEEIVNKDGKQTTVKQPVPMPEGVSDYAIGHDVSALKAARVSSNDLRRVPVLVEEVEEEEEIFIVIEEDPEFPGGLDSLRAFIQRNLRYPEEAKRNKIEGKVFVSFIIEADGSVSNIKVLRDIGGGCGAEAVRVVKLMPKWKPGKQHGKAVRTQFNLPIQFVLPKE
jgi:Ca-activated chloride channel family protein